MDGSAHVSVNADNFEHNVRSHTSRLKSEVDRKASLYFWDGNRSVDFVLVWDDLKPISVAQPAMEKRSIFEMNLQHEGLELEYEKREPNGLNFIKVHAPIEVLRRYSEILKLRMAVKEELCRVVKGNKLNPLLHATLYLSQKVPGLQEIHHKTNSLVDGISSCFHRMMSKVYVDPQVFPTKSHRFTAVYSRDKEYLFDIHAQDFFNPSIRSRIVQFILDRQRFSTKTDDDFAFGIERLINEGAYTAAYPLHDGDLRQPGSMRNTLYTEWAAVNKLFHYQPLDYIKDYFGVKISLYFAWLGFYTHMLIPASVVGVICFLYSCFTLYDNHPSEDICTRKFNYTMCPQCDHFCGYWNLQTTCLHSRITYLFDNPTTVFFAIFMSFWAATFLELWKRYSAEITHRWDLSGFDIREEHPRPQYLARLKNVKRREINIITNMMEPRVPFWRLKFPATLFSFSVVLLLEIITDMIPEALILESSFSSDLSIANVLKFHKVALAVAAVLAVVLYRMSVLAALAVQRKAFDTNYAILFTTSTAACINLLCIMVFNWVYTLVAEYLTEMELLRTQTEFDDSLTLKIYLLEFVNYYASIFYIAFFKGKLIGYPGKYNRFFGHRQEECGPGGCLMELCIQLAIIMVGKQIMNTILEMVFPLFYKWLNTLKVKAGNVEGQQPSFSHYQWVKDFKLVEWGPQGLFPEYLEMVLQYGFVTIFVAAFPLAPFFALLNNILEMRLDAKKLLTYFRRPVSQRVRDIGVWFRILDSIGKLSVISNAFIIAFTSDFIPHLVYATTISPNRSLEGFLNFSLSHFNTSDFEPDSEPNTGEHVEICRYPDYREPPWSKDNYKRTAMYWHILAARLAFVVVFENVVALVMILVKWCIPDMSRTLRDKIRREAYITNEIIIQQEAIRARNNQNADLSGSTVDIPESWHSFSGPDLDLAMMEHHEREVDSSARKRIGDISTAV